MNNLYQLLSSENFRRRPIMYIGKLSIANLRVYLDGYSHALYLHRIKEDNNIFEMEAANFNNFVANYYNILPQESWDNIILNENRKDEPDSFKDFFILLDKFFKEEKSQSFYLNLSKLYRGQITQEEMIFDLNF